MNSANGSDVVDGTEVHFIDGLRLIGRVDTETHEGSGHTGVVVNNEHVMMVPFLLTGRGPTKKPPPESPAAITGPDP